MSSLTATAEAVIALHRAALEKQLEQLERLRKNQIGPMQVHEIRRAVGRLLTRAGESLIADATKALDEPRKRARREILEADARADQGAR